MKVSIIGGGGLVGSSAGFALQCGGVVREIALLDVNQELANGQALDLLHGSPSVADQRIVSGSYEQVPDSDIICITAGLRRKGKVFEAIEKFSVVKTLQAIESAHVVLLLLDATQGVTDQDAHIAGYILESGRAVVLAVNKWDAVDAYQRELLQRSIETRLTFLKFARLH